MTGFRLTRAQMRAADRLAIDEYGIPGCVLMENAGRAVVECLLPRSVPDVPAARRAWRALVFTGPGQNGGDGFVVARWLRERDLDVHVLATAPIEALRGDAAILAGAAERVGVPRVSIATGADLARARERFLADPAFDVCVDALLGTGFEGPPRPPVAGAIELVNDLRRRGARVVAIDLPSGLDADTGLVSTPCVRADLTVTFECEKAGFDNPAARAVLGEVRCASVGIPRDALDRARGSPRRRAPPHGLAPPPTRI